MEEFSEENKTKNLTEEELGTIDQFQAKNAKKFGVNNDKRAQQEEDHLYKDGERGEVFRTHIHKVAIAFIYVVSAILLLMIVIRAWHLMVCEKLQWLDATQLHDIERVIFSGLILSIAGKYFKKYTLFDKDDKP